MFWSVICFFKTFVILICFSLQGIILFEGILSDASGEEMESADELYEAVGEMLLEVNGNKGKEKIYEICKLLYTTNKK